jgi:hypothetical protein
MHDAVALDHNGYKFDWLCEKWSEDACVFARKQLDKLGITHVIGHMKEIRPGLILPGLVPIKHAVPSSVLRAFVGEPEEAVSVNGNLLVNEGIQRLQDLTMIATVLTNQTAANAWGNTNAFLGVGDSSTAEAATQTELQAATNRFYKAMNATFPSRSSQTVTFQSDFTSAEANYVWAEWSVSAGATTASGSGFTTGTTNLNRKVAALGTKSTGTWTLSGQLTLS